jgi:hypothetical protein
MTRKKGRENFDGILDEETGGKPAVDEPKRIDAEDEELDTIFSGFPQHDACLELWRTTEKGGKPSFLEDIAPADFSFGTIASTYGGGRYIVKGKYKDGTYVKRNFDVEGAPFPLKRKVPDAGPSMVAAPAQVQERVEVVRDPQGHPDALATVVSMFKSMLLEMRTSEDQVLDKLTKYKALFGTETKQQTPVAEAIALVKTGIELGSSGGGESGGIPWLLIADKLQGPLTDIASAIVRGVTKPNPGAVAIPNSLNGQPAQPEQPAQPKPQGETKTMEMILLGALREILPMLVTGAAQKAEPGFYSDLMLDQIPRQFYATAKTFLEKPDCIEQLAKLNPAVSTHTLWFESLKAELIAALTEELGGDATGSVQSQQATDTSADRSTDL